MRKRILYLRVKEKWFYQIKAGIKTEEYRLYKMYWQRILEGHVFDSVHVIWGYPSSTETDKILIFPWNGYVLKTVTSEEWDNEPKLVFVIQLRKEICDGKK